MLKIDRSKRIMAILFSSTLVFGSNVCFGENKVNAYTEDNMLNIYEYGHYEIKINEEIIDNLIEDGGLYVKLGDEVICIDSKELSEIKKKALDDERELNCYKAIIYTSFGAIILCIVKSQIKSFVKRRY